VGSKKALAAAGRKLLAESGIKGLTMSAVADRSGLARATAYNHIRDRDELLVLVSEDIFTELLAVASSQTNAAAMLVTAAHWLAEDPAIVGLRKYDADVLNHAVAYVVSLPDRVAVSVIEVLQSVNVHADLSAAEVVLRWLSSYVVFPGSAIERETGAEIIAGTLRTDARL